MAADAGLRFLGSEVYRGSSYGGWHPLRIPRVSTVMDLTRALGWRPREASMTSPRAKPAALTIWHTPEYVAALEAAERDQTVTDEVRERHGLGTATNPVFPEIWRRPTTSAGGTFLAADLLMRGFTVYHPGGGTHHGMADRANGFCYLNDPVLAMKALRRLGLTRIAYVDIDAHHADGVEAGMGGDMEALLISVHEEKRWPFTGELENDAGGNALNLPVPRGFNDTEMAYVRDELLLPALNAFAPEALLLQCGADSLLEDPLSRLALSNRAYWDTVAALRHAAPRVMVVGGGGYNPWSVGRCWTGIWGTLWGAEIPDRLPEEAEAVLRSLRWEGTRAGKSPPRQWLTTLADDPRPGPVREEIRERVAVLRSRSLFRAEI